MNTELSPVHLDGIYESIRIYSTMLNAAARKTNPIQIYEMMNKLDTFRVRLQQHFAAVEIRKANE